MVPVIVGGAALAATGAYLFLSGKKPKVPGKVTTPATTTVPKSGVIAGKYGPVQAVIIQVPAAVAVVPGGGTIVQTGTTPAGSPIVGTATLQQGSPASIAANNLHDYLKANGVDGSSTLQGLVKAFQSAGIADVKDVGYGDSMLVNGVYDLPTSAALSIFLGDPIAPDKQGQPFAAMPFSYISDTNKPGLSVMSGNNVYFYLRLHGNDKSAALIDLTKQFQHDVNTDLKFPKGHVKGKLAEDGKYGPATAGALSVYGFAIKP